MLKQSSTLLDGMGQMPVGRVLLVNLPVTQAGIDLGKDPPDMFLWWWWWW